MRFRRASILTVVVVVLALVLGSVITQRLPTADDVSRAPFPHPAVIGQQTRLRTSLVTVDGVSGARVIWHETSARLSSSAHSVDGLWLAVAISFTPLGEPGSPSVAGMRIKTSDGRTFSNARLRVEPLCGATQPGFVRSCTVVFEVDPDVVSGAHLLWPTTDLLSNDDVADVDLGITPDVAAQLTSNTNPLKLPDATERSGP